MRLFKGGDLRLLAKWFLFPGLDLHTRCRYHFLPFFFRSGPIDTLDAGCGNGALSYAAYKLGNSVLGITNNMEQVRRAEEFFGAFGVDRTRFQFQMMDLYDLPRLGRKFDQIICSETLEHIRRDDVVIRYFYDILRPGGVLHLCCPFELHPDNNLGRVDAREDGGHVRDGYTAGSYRRLLEPAGFKVVATMGLGSPLLAGIDKPLRRIRNRFGDAAALPFFLFTLPLQALDPPDPRVPFSLYVQAVK